MWPATVADMKGGLIANKGSSGKLVLTPISVQPQAAASRAVKVKVFATQCANTHSYHLTQGTPKHTRLRQSRIICIAGY